MEALKNKRQVLKGSVTRIYNACSDQEASLEFIKVRVAKLDAVFADFESVQDEIDALITDDATRRAEEQYRSDIEEKYFCVKELYASRSREEDLDRTVMGANSGANMGQVLEAISQTQNSFSSLIDRLANDRILHSSPLNQEIVRTQEPRLPTIDIPNFDGAYSEWIRFRDLFEALIHNRTSLSNVEKLEYLQTKLKGEALTLIKHLKPTNDNYCIAWDLLKNKFNESEHVKLSYMKLLFDQPPIRSVSLGEIKRFYNNINESINALVVLDEPVEYWDGILLFHLERKLDSDTNQLWCRHKSGERKVSFKKFMKFLEDRIFELECVESTSNRSQNRLRGQTNAYAASLQNCICCQLEHALFECPKFMELTIAQRKQLVFDNKLCLNCLRPSHFANNCKGSSCKICNLRHNTLLHISKNAERQIYEEPQQQVLTNYYTSKRGKQMARSSNCVSLLPTAMVMIRNFYGKLIPCRALLDTGAQATLITESCIQNLRLRRNYDRTVLFGVGPSDGNYTKGKVCIEIASSTGSFSKIAHAYILSKLTKDIPPYDICIEKFKYFQNLGLADNSFNKSSKIDIILGADVFSESILPEKITHPSGSPIAMNTVFGWIIMGAIDRNETKGIFAGHVSLNIDNMLRRFWEIEELPQSFEVLSEEEKQAENHYQRNVTRLENGRYMVRLPLREDIVLGESKYAAGKRMLSMEKRFIKLPEIRMEYTQFMKEFLNLKHMEEHISEAGEYFLPHHAVLKPNSSTTRLRVVFDGSSKTDTGNSLNDKLLTGPTVQNDIFTIILNFRKYKIGFCSDIEKMYRQILIHPDDRKYQCILWRNNMNEQLKLYHLNTVTYGTSAAPFLATRTLHQIALDHADQKEVAEAIDQNFYVDDFMACSNDLSCAVKLKNDISAVLSRSGFRLRKWASNSREFISTIDPDDREIKNEATIHISDTVKTLGLSWDTSTDFFIFSFYLEPHSERITKRVVLSIIARIFDPIGWISPVVVSMKIFMQRLWLHGVDWDCELPETLQKRWKELYEDLENIGELRIPRWIGIEGDGNLELHGFADSSESAYAAVIYVRYVTPNGNVITNLVTSKTRVAPIKQISLPRLELCAAHLLVKLMLKVQGSYKINSSKMYGWSDSTVVLTWLSDQPRRWKNYVANRTSFIIEHMPYQQWHHIRSKSNPADLATRGMFTSTLKNSDLWWKGPTEIRGRIILLENKVPFECGKDIEERNEFNIGIISGIEWNIFNRFSNYNKLQRIVALINRFTHNCKVKGLDRRFGYLTSSDLMQAELLLIKKAQQESYYEEIRALSLDRQLPNSKRLSNLTPFLDDDGIMRVGGRLENAQIGYNQKHPIILCKNHPLTELLIRYYHQKYLHAGRRQTTYLIGLRFWISNMTHIVKSVVYKCTTCMRYRAATHEQQMAPLPYYRLQQCPPFSNTGVDYAGPFSIRSWKGRGSKLYKTWLAVFVCLGTKAVHLELVTELSTAAFIAAFRRFIARRGKPIQMFSDNGTNFVGCNKELRELYQYLTQGNTQFSMNKEMSENGIKWHFTPPAAPHFGGIWEASVKSAKFHLKRVLANASVTFEEMYTLTCQIEGCLNSRPICLKFEADLDPLTPSHFLILRSMAAVPDENSNDSKINYNDRWRYVQRLVNEFWRKWSFEYLGQLQKRPKWSQKLENIRIDDVVLIKDDNLPPAQWSVARVVQIHPGSDSLVRVVTVKTAKGTYKRPITKLCPLFLEI